LLALDGSASAHPEPEEEERRLWRPV
jgi:hypothetical protein